MLEIVCTWLLIKELLDIYRWRFKRSINEKVNIQAKIKDLMTKSYITVNSSALAVDAAKIMEKNKIFTLVTEEIQCYLCMINEARICKKINFHI